jgi:hypothetical protein
MKRLFVLLIDIALALTLLTNCRGVKTDVEAVSIVENADSVLTLSLITKALQHKVFYSDYIQPRRDKTPYVIDVSLINLPYQFSEVKMDSITTLRFIPEDSLMNDKPCNSILFEDFELDGDSLSLFYTFNPYTTRKIGVDCKFFIAGDSVSLINCEYNLVSPIPFSPPIITR